MSHIAVYRYGEREIYGLGDGSDDAIADAVLNGDINSVDEGEEMTEDSFDALACTDALAAQVERGDCSTYARRGRHAYTLAEAEAVDAGLDVSDDGTATGEVHLDEDDAERLGVARTVRVTIARSSMTARYTTEAGGAHEVAEEPSGPEQLARLYDWQLGNVGAAALDLVAQGVARDAEAEAA